MKYKIRTTQLAVLPPTDPIFAEQCTLITIEDEGAGEYISVEQQSGHTSVKPQKIQIENLDEWKAIKQAVDQLFNESDQNGISSSS